MFAVEQPVKVLDVVVMIQPGKLKSAKICKYKIQRSKVMSMKKRIKVKGHVYE